MTNLKTATNAAPSVLVAQYVPTTGAAQYTAPVGTTTQITSLFVTNADESGSPAAQTVTVSVVKASGSAGGANRVLPKISLGIGDTVDVGEMFLGDGDFIWAEAVNASKVSIVITGIEFSNATGAALTGIQDDAIGSGGRTTGTGTVTGTNAIGTGSSRYLIAGLSAQSSTFAAYSTYTTLSMSCAGTAMTKLGSVDINPAGGGVKASVHLFGLATSLTSGSTPTITANVAKSGVTFNLIMASMSLSGVASVTGVATDGPTTDSAVNCSVTSAAGHRVFYIVGGAGSGSLPAATPQDFNRRARYYNWNIDSFASIHSMIFADAPGAATVAATTGNTLYHGAVGIDMVPTP